MFSLSSLETTFHRLKDKFSSLYLPQGSDPFEHEMKAQSFLQKAIQTIDSINPFEQRKFASELIVLLQQANNETLSFYLSSLSIGLGMERQSLQQFLQHVDPQDVDLAQIEVQVQQLAHNPRQQLLNVWLSLPHSVPFLVWLRGCTLERLHNEPWLEPLERDLFQRLQIIFSQGLLEMKSVDWRSCSDRLERVIEYAHQTSPEQRRLLRDSLGRQRYYFAFFHSGWAHEPFVFMEVLLTHGRISSMSDLRAKKTSESFNTAMLCPIVSPHRGLDGISFGSDLIRQALLYLHTHQPQLQKYYALARIPSLKSWIEKQSENQIQSLLTSSWLEKAQQQSHLPFMTQGVKPFLLDPLVSDHHASFELSSFASSHFNTPWAQHMLKKFAYACITDTQHPDPYAQFHLGCGAHLDAIHWMSDLSMKNVSSSFGLTASYEYRIHDLERNAKHLAQGSVPQAWKIRFFN